MSVLFGLFPFVIFFTILIGWASRWLYGADAIADQAVLFLFDGWPEAAAEPIAAEIRNVLGVPRKGLLTLSALLTLILASNVIEALRVPLNRTYGFKDKRSYLRLRFQSIGFIIIGSLGFLTTLLLLVLAPVVLTVAGHYVPNLASQVDGFQLFRIAAAATVLALCLLAFHRWLPAGRRRWRTIFPGVVFTMVGFVVASSLFGAYLDGFARYADTYAGLAGFMIGIFYLYCLAAIFIFGAEINAAIIERRNASKANQAANI